MTAADGANLVINDVPALHGNLWEVKDGPWTVELTGAAEELEAGPAFLYLYGKEYRGYIVRPGSFAERAPVMVVGCRGGLLGLCPPKSYARGVQLREPLQDLLRVIGEELDPDTDPALLATPLTAWVRRGGPAERALTELVRAIPLDPKGNPALWRTTPAGKVLIVRDAWPDDTPEEVNLMDGEPDIDMKTYAVGEPSIHPGTLFEGRPVSEVHYHFSETTRADVYFDDLRARAASRYRGVFFELAEEATAQTEYHPRYPAEVRDAGDDNTATVHFDSSAFADQQVRLLAPFPGGRIKPRIGDRVHVTFSGGSPQAVRADGWESNGKNARPLVRKGDRVKVGWLVVQYGNVGMGGAPAVTAIAWVDPDKKPPPRVPPVGGPVITDVIELWGRADEGSDIIGAE
jgi:murein DD-endopeptidase MepM/ murein hydrolase activator NlpD